MEWTLRPKAQRHALLGGLRALQRSYSLILFVVAWELVARLINNPLFLPTFSGVLGVLGQLLVSGELLGHTAISTFRAPTIAAPAVGCNAGPPISGRFDTSTRPAFRRPSN